WSVAVALCLSLVAFCARLHALSPLRHVISGYRGVAKEIASFHPRTLPQMLRASYGREFVAWWFLPLMLGAIEGGVISVIVKRGFAGVPSISAAQLNFAVAAVTAAP